VLALAHFEVLVQSEHLHNGKNVHTAYYPDHVTLCWGVNRIYYINESYGSWPVGLRLQSHDNTRLYGDTHYSSIQPVVFQCQNHHSSLPFEPQTDVTLC
jgi:hypothetical protein